MADPASPSSDDELSPIAGRLHAAAIHLLRRVRREDAASGLPPARLSALSVLVFGGRRTMGALAAAEQVAAPTMTRIVGALERDGLVQRAPDPADGRVVRVEATPAGRRILEEGRARRVRRLSELLRRLPPADARRLGELATLLEGLLAADSHSRPPDAANPPTQASPGA